MMFLPIVECICVPFDEGEAGTYLSVLIAHHPEIAVRAERTRTATGSARATLESLVEDGTFERISEDYARCLEKQVERYEAKDSGRAKADIRRPV